VRNLLGYGGAMIADLMMQLFGIASVAVVLPIQLRRLPAAHRRVAAARRSRRRHWRRAFAPCGLGRRQ
jgi:hypothetical protein